MLNHQLPLVAFFSSLVFASAFPTIKLPQPASSYKRSLKDGNGLILRVAPSNSADTTANDATMIRGMIGDMTSFFGDMTDLESSRFYALCFPPSGERKHQHNPIRDLAAAWDATKALLFLAEIGEEVPHQERLTNAIYTTIQPYQAALISVDDGNGGSAMALDSNALLEPPNIAHSALLVLASTGALKLSLFQDNIPPTSIDSLARGILSMQRQDGAFCINFGNGENDTNVYRGIEFYPGEAMLALMQVHELASSIQGLLKDSTRQDILPAMERAFSFYSAYYHQGDVDTNYNIWQVQTFSILFDALYVSGNQSKAAMVATYVLSLCQGVIDSKSWKYELARGRSFYPNLDTVEIACGLDALADGIHVARRITDSRLEVFERQAKNAVYFLQWAQEQVPAEVSVGRGGLGYGGVSVLEQRLDVTGHAISALTKLSSPIS